MDISTTSNMAHITPWRSNLSVNGRTKEKQSENLKIIVRNLTKERVTICHDTAEILIHGRQNDAFKTAEYCSLKVLHTSVATKNC